MNLRNMITYTAVQFIALPDWTRWQSVLESRTRVWTLRTYVQKPLHLSGPIFGAVCILLQCNKLVWIYSKSTSLWAVGNSAKEHMHSNLGSSSLITLCSHPAKSIKMCKYTDNAFRMEKPGGPVILDFANIETGLSFEGTLMPSWQSLPEEKFRIGNTIAKKMPKFHRGRYIYVGECS